MVTFLMSLTVNLGQIALKDLQHNFMTIKVHGLEHGVMIAHFKLIVLKCGILMGTQLNKVNDCVIN